MLKRLRVPFALLLFFALVYGYFQIQSWRIKQKVLGELGPFLADEQQQKSALLALERVDLNPSTLTLATLEQKLKTPVLKKSGDFNSTRLGWACGKERCAIWATFLVPIGQDIPPDTTPAGLIIKSPTLDNYPNLSIREFHLGDSDQKLVELSKGTVGASSKTLYHRFSWDKDWSAAWSSLDGRVFSFVFANDTLLSGLMHGPQGVAQPSAKAAK
jgi:hypothetical protein